MDLYDTLTSVFNGLAHTTSEIDKSLHKNKPYYETESIDFDDDAIGKSIFLTRQDTYRISNNLFTQKAMSWRKTICPEGLSVPLLLPDCNNRYYSKYCLFHLRSCF